MSPMVITITDSFSAVGFYPFVNSDFFCEGAQRTNSYHPVSK